ncbi:MAG: putative MazG family protein [Ilumatobacteraceae bacterium]|nr:putative MazG family protein [Ilumatobacteraceae bacterium]
MNELPRITVVGLGPGDERFVTAETLAVLTTAPARFIRTTRHPSASLAGDAVSFDDVYDAEDSFGDVYATIVDRLVSAATQHGHVVYAVPGSPLVLERTVRLLRADARIQCVVLPAISFLDLAYDRLGIDPIESRIRLIDGHDFAVASAGDTGPLLVAHTHANWVLSDIKLAVESATGDEPVVILQRLGTSEEHVVHTTWAELDRTVEADHLTCIYIPELAAPVGGELLRFHQLSRVLREECPWDREQTHQSLVKYLLEETYEVVDAIQSLDSHDPTTDDDLIEELGDLLYQIEFHATIAEQQGRFTMADVAKGVHDKLVRRHPHVFGDVVVDGADQVVENWDAIKRAEKQRTSVFDGVANSQPSLAYAYGVQRKAAKVGFDWPDIGGAIPKIAEETAEVLEAIAQRDERAVADEVGDLLFAVVNVARHAGIEPEAALRAATQKFRRRFEAVEQLASARAIDLHEIAKRPDGLATLDALWDQVKSDE